MFRGSCVSCNSGKTYEAGRITACLRCVALMRYDTDTAGKRNHENARIPQIVRKTDTNTFDDVESLESVIMNEGLNMLGDSSFA